MTSDSTYWSYSNKIATSQIKEIQVRRSGRAKKWSFGSEPNDTEMYEEINQSSSGGRTVVFQKDGQEISVRQLWITPEFTYWINPQIKQQTIPIYITVATSQINEVQFIRRGKGALEGMGIGFLVGALVGFTAGEDCQESRFICFSREEVAVGVGLWGSIFGAPVEAISGHRDVYQIGHKKDTGTN